MGGIGVAIGLVGTINVAFALRHLLYGVSPLHPLYLAGGALLVLAIAPLAGYLPARRAAALDPMEALRCEGWKRGTRTVERGTCRQPTANRGQLTTDHGP